MGYLKLHWLRLLLILDDLINGVYSGFPLCCILFYIRIHCAGLRLPGHYLRNHVPNDSEPGYVRCPACTRSNHRIKHIRKGHIKLCKYNTTTICKHYPLSINKKELCFKCNIPMYKLFAKGQHICKKCGIVYVD
jgi:hypothetical protein